MYFKQLQPVCNLPRDNYLTVNHPFLFLSRKTYNSTVITSQTEETSKSF